MDVGVIAFLHLPVELICNVLQLISVKDLLQCNLVCKRLWRIVNDSSALQFTIELSRCRMKPALTSDLSFASRLQLLRDREKAWRTFNPKSRHKLKLIHSGTIYEFAGDVYGSGKEIDGRTSRITFYDLPSGASGAQRSITHIFSDINVVDFTMDPSQDLLVLVSINHDSPYMYDLHLRTLSTNEPHPLAPAPILPCCEKQPDLNLTEGAVQIQIAGDTLGFLAKEEFLSLQAHFEVFKWRAGFPNSCVIECAYGIVDFTFLSKDHFLLVQPSGLFDVYKFSDSMSTSFNPHLRASYELPTLSPAHSFWYISLSSNPSPCFPGPAETKKAYHCSPDDRLHACCIYVYQPASPNMDTVYPFVFFFHPKTLLNIPNIPRGRENPENDVGTYMSSSWDSNTTIGHVNNALWLPILNDDSPVSSSLLPSASPISSSPPSSPPSTASSVSLDDYSSGLLNFPAPNASHAGSSSMLFDTSPSTSGRASPDVGRYDLVPWEAWGPQNTRWFKEHLSKDWQRSVYGLRTADCVVDRTALENLLHRSGNTNANGIVDIGNDTTADSYSEGDDGDESDENGFVFINEVAFSVGDIESQLGCTGTLPKFLRVRDFNPYSISKAMEELAMAESSNIQNLLSSPEASHASCSSSYVEQEIHGVSSDMIRDRGGDRRVITTPTKINVRGVFTKNITSCLPYVEVVSKDTFDVNEVMIDESRLLLIKRGRGRKLKTINVLTM